MPAARHCSRIDTFELKVKMERRLGSQKAEKYFSLLTTFLSLKLSKSEFDRLCFRLIGKENVLLHNEIIRAILKNATLSKTPPPKQVKRDSLLALKDPNGIDPRNGLESLCRDVFPQSARKGRTPILRESKFKDIRSPFAVNGKMHTAEDLAIPKGQEQERANGMLSLLRKPSNDVNSMKDGEDVQQDASSPSLYRRIPVTAPFGITIHSNKKREVLGSGSGPETCHYSGQLPPNNYLENRLKEKLKMKGLDVSTDCVNLLTNGLNSYITRVVKPSLQFARSRSLHTLERRSTTSVLDFWVATESNPTILGEDWPIQLENINLFAFDQSAGYDGSLKCMPQ